MLRGYQKESLNGNEDYSGILHDLSTRNTALLVLPTGTGKTCVFTSAARQYVDVGKRVLIIAHRGELLQQAREKLLQFGGFKQYEIGLEKSEHTVIGMRNIPSVIVASKDSLHKDRIAHFDSDLFGLIIVDEAHHGIAKSYTHIYEHFNTADLLGVTATPGRKDKLDIRKVFGEPSYVYEIRQAISDKYLVPISVAIVDVSTIDLRDIKVNSFGDFTESELEEMMLRESNLHGVAVPTIEQSENRQTLVFCTGVKHAQSMAEVLNRYKPGKAIAIHGDTDEQTRNRIYRQFRNGDMQYLCNCALLLEGYDEPVISCVAMARPTKSKTLYCQGVGRGTRLLGDDYLESIANGKSNLLLLDFVGNSGKHTLITGFDVVGGIEDEKTHKKAIELARKSGKPLDVIEGIKQAETEVAEEETAKILANVNYEIKVTSPFTVLGIYPSVSTNSVPITERQKELLLKNGIKEKEIEAIDKWQASKMIEKIIQRSKENLCTYKQARLLLRYGINPNVSFVAAKRIMDLVSKENWRMNPELKSQCMRIAYNDQHKQKVVV